MQSHTPTFPREIAKGIHWLGACLPTEFRGRQFHVHMGLFLLVGSRYSLLVDTGTPGYWEEISGHITKALAGRQLDFIMPTHPEIPHASALPLLLDRYPGAKVVGDMRDYALFFPEYESRLIHKNRGEELDLGGLRFIFVDALIKDLPNTMWGYERNRQALFVADGFSFTHDTHDKPKSDEPIHLPGECAMTSSELAGGVNKDQASYLLRAALYWSRFVKAEHLFDDVAEFFEKYPTRFICPAHGNVIDDPDIVVPVIRNVHEIAFETTMSGGIV